MIFFSEKDLNKKIVNVLLGIEGFGHYRSKYLCQKFGYQEKSILSDLDIIELEKLRDYIEKNFIVNKNLNQNISNRINSFIKLGIYKGKRHQFGYPVRGQRTLSNGKSQKRLSNRRFHHNIDNSSNIKFSKKKRFKKRKLKKKY